MNALDERPEGRCWPWSHDWSRWRPTYLGSAYDHRTCLRCGRRKTRIT